MRMSSFRLVHKREQERLPSVSSDHAMDVGVTIMTNLQVPERRFEFMLLPQHRNTVSIKFE